MIGPCERNSIPFALVIDMNETVKNNFNRKYMKAPLYGRCAAISSSRGDSKEGIIAKDLIFMKQSTVELSVCKK